MTFAFEINKDAILTDRNQTCDDEKLVENSVVEASLHCENAAVKVAATIENENTIKHNPLGDVDAELVKC